MAGKPQKEFDLTPENLRNAEKWSSEGYTIASIAKAFGVGVTTFRNWRKKHKELDDAIERGRIHDEQLCMNRLREIAFNDGHKQHLTALLAYGKIKHRWNDGSRLDEATVPALPKAIPVELDE